MLNPVAKYHHAVVACEHKVEQDVAMTEYKILGIMLFDILFGKLYEGFVLLATEMLFTLLVVFLTA